MSEPNRTLGEGLATALDRVGTGGEITGLERLSGGASMESWAFDCAGEAWVLRRAPSASMMEGRALSHAGEAAVIRAARACGVPAPEIAVEFEPRDGIGSGYVMRRIAGTPDPRAALASPDPGRLLAELAATLGQIHSVPLPSLPALPPLDPAAGVEGLARQFAEHGGDRPIIALGLAWLRGNLPKPLAPTLIHGDFRLGNLMTDQGRLTGVLDWELAHTGDFHEDLAFGCMAVWRFGSRQPAFGLGELDPFFQEYEAGSGQPVDPARFRFWLIYRTVWWALGCLGMGQTWRTGADRSLERVVVAHRTAEQELDLLLLLEDEASIEERSRALPDDRAPAARTSGEPSAEEMVTAVSEWLAGVKEQFSGRGRFEHAVARNALGIVARQLALQPRAEDRVLADEFLAGHQTLATPGLLARLRRSALTKLAADQPKYPSLAIARENWEVH
jgi:aminoglycoside phosphotransferase (APT) family kinase protein